MPNRKKIAPRGTYDSQFIRTTKKTGKWRGVLAHIYKKYKRIRKALPKPYLVGKGDNEMLIVPDGCYKPTVLDWGKQKYQSID